MTGHVQRALERKCNYYRDRLIDHEEVDRRWRAHDERIEREEREKQEKREGQGGREARQRWSNSNLILRIIILFSGAVAEQPQHPKGERGKDAKKGGKKEEDQGLYERIATYTWRRLGIGGPKKEKKD